MGEKLTRQDFEKFCTKLWGVWKDRCTLAHKHQKSKICADTEPLGQWTDNYLHEFYNANNRLPSTGNSLIKRYSSIDKEPPPSLYTVFTDVAFCDTYAKYAIAFVVFDPGGSLKRQGTVRLNTQGR